MTFLLSASGMYLSNDSKIHRTFHLTVLLITASGVQAGGSPV